MPPTLLHHAAAALGLTLVACAGRLPSSERPHLAIVTTVEVAAASDPSSHIPDCDLVDELLDELADEAERHFELRRVTDSRDVPGRVLVLRFAQVEGAWGGAISGSKSVTVTGDLLEGGSAVGSFTAREETSAFTVSARGTTCSLLEEAVEEIAEDVTEWLRAPSHGARLGDL